MSSKPNALTKQAETARLQGRFAEAERLYRAALSSASDFVPALLGLGSLCLQCRRADEAVGVLQRAAAADPSSASTCNTLGLALSASGRVAEAAEVYRRAAELAPESPVIRLNLGRSLVRLGRRTEARRCLEAAAGLRIADAETRLVLGEALLLCDGYARAAEIFREVLKSGEAPRPLSDLGEALGGLERHAEAAECFRRAAAAAPDNAQLHYNWGMAASFSGRMEDAATAFERAAALAPHVPSFQRAAVAAHRVTADDPHFAALKRIAAEDPQDMPDAERIELHFALAKSYDDLGRYAQAQTHLAAGNALKRASVVYDEAKTLAQFDAIAETFSPDLLRRGHDGGAASEVPVFVVGMPRSGTTLLEQVLASHPSVCGAGECTILFDLVRTGRAGADFPAGVADLSGEAWRRLGEDYLAGLTALAPEALRIVDKLPLNFAYLGVIRLALPQARIIHIRRNPVDTCFSCYFQLFDGDQPFAYDLGELGRYYCAYERLMAHWRAVLPPDRFLEIDYEDLVEDFEANVRRILAYCRLPWDAGCLCFHATRRNVRTASAYQVRQPLYRSAVGRANAYHSWLKPLYTALGREWDV